MDFDGSKIRVSLTICKGLKDAFDKLGKKNFSGYVEGLIRKDLRDKLEGIEFCYCANCDCEILKTGLKDIVKKNHCKCPSCKQNFFVKEPSKPEDFVGAKQLKNFLESR